jgi:peptidyl-prolyl cis-trans isomerase C
MFSTVLLASANSFAVGNNGVAAVVNGKNIKVDDIKVAFDANPVLKGKTSFEEFYGRTLNIFVDGEIVYQEAVKANIENDPAYKKQLETLKEELARKIYLEKEVGKKVTAEAVKKLYQDYKNTFNGEKEVKAKHILVKDEATAKEVIAKFQENGDFEKLAKEYSKEPADLGYFTGGVMVPEFADAAFKLKKGEYTKTPVKTQFGYHVILVEDIRDAKPQDFDKIENQLKAMLAQKTMGDIIKDLQSKAKVVRYDVEGKVIND